MYANPDVWCCLLSGQASNGSELMDCDQIDEMGVIGCHIDSNHGTVTFYKNDEYLLQFDNLNDHPAMKSSPTGIYTDVTKRGVRPFCCLEVGGDSMFLVGSKSEDTIVTYPESDPLGRASLSGQVINSNFEGLCELRQWGSEGKWVGYYRDGVKEGTHVYLEPKIPRTISSDLVPLVESDGMRLPVSQVDGVTMDTYLGTQVESLSNTNPNIDTGSVPVQNTSSALLGGEGGLEGGERGSSSHGQLAALSGINSSEQSGNEMEGKGGGAILAQVPEAGNVLPVVATTDANSISPSLSISTFYSMSNSKSSSFSILPDNGEEKTIKEDEEFTSMTEFKLYVNGQYVRDLTEVEKVTDFVVSECRKNIEEEKERILLERSMVMSGAPLSAPTSLDKKKKLKKKVEKSRTNTK